MYIDRSNGTVSVVRSACVGPLKTFRGVIDCADIDFANMTRGVARKAMFDAGLLTGLVMVIPDGP